MPRRRARSRSKSGGGPWRRRSVVRALHAGRSADRKLGKVLGHAGIERAAALIAGRRSLLGGREQALVYPNGDDVTDRQVGAVGGPAAARRPGLRRYIARG